MKRQTLLTTCFLGAFAFPAYAEIERQHGAHVHGTGELNIAVSGDKLTIELEAPSFDIVGFGHKATTEGDKKTAATALANLKASDTLFTLPSAAQCKVLKVDVEHEITSGDHDDHKDEKGHDDHKDEKDHDDHKGEKGHDDHKGEKKATHSEYHAKYSYQCASISALDSLKVNYFKLFERAEKLVVQKVTDKGQSRTELTKEKNVISFK